MVPGLGTYNDQKVEFKNFHLDLLSWLKCLQCNAATNFSTKPIFFFLTGIYQLHFNLRVGQRALELRMSLSSRDAPGSNPEHNTYNLSF